jgi:peptidoglycan/xylan/chitin deacetylase (PgdA/CDA1 family)
MHTIESNMDDSDECGAPNAGAILLYHRVANLEHDVHNLSVKPADFRDHVQFLSRHCHPIPLEDLVQAAADRRMPRRAVAVTFDDGYLDVLEEALPLLAEFDVPATFFITTDHLNEPREFWWDTLERIFCDGHPLPPVLHQAALGQDGGECRTTSHAERKAAHDIVWRTLYGSTTAARNELLTRVIEWSGLDATPRRSHRPMLGSEVRELAAWHGATIGAHSIHHLVLPAQSTEVQTREVVENKKDLEQLLGRPVTAFAYPYGEYSDTTEAIVRNADFKTAVTVDEALVRPGVGPWRVGRYEIKGCPRDAFATRLEHIFGASVGPPAAG